MPWTIEGAGFACTIHCLHRPRDSTGFRGLPRIFPRKGPLRRCTIPHNAGVAGSVPPLLLVPHSLGASLEVLREVSANRVLLPAASTTPGRQHGAVHSPSRLSATSVIVNLGAASDVDYDLPAPFRAL